MKTHDEFLRERLQRLHDTPMQRKLRKLAPMPVGCVFLPWPGMTEQQAREHFQLMKKLGFTCLKQTMDTPEWPVERTLSLALQEGIWPFWYAEGGFEDITPALLKKLGLPPDMDVDAAIAHPKMIAHQSELMRRRIQRGKAAPHIAAAGETKRAGRLDVTWVPGVVGDIKGHELHPESLPHFVEWLKNRYRSLQNLKEAWNFRHVGIPAHDWKSWDDVTETLKQGIPAREYRRVRDALRFRADTFTRQYVTERIRRQRAIDPDEPLRAGGEMGLFLPFASRGTDMEQIARQMAEGGSFYPSIHLAWHFEEVNFEVARPVYMQAQLAHDWAKGIWSATWESTGGPQYFSGGKSPFVKETQDKQPGFTVDAGVMTQLMLSWLAAGFKGFGLWAWNYRTAGWEGGEYALVDRNLQPNERTVRVGRIGQAARRWRRELWQAQKEPFVGVMVDWENEAIWAAMSVTGREFYKTLPVRARIGVSRALINANVPWEYVTPANLRDGLAPRYRVIYLPAFISIGTELQPMLADYVRQGGRLLLDMPGAYYDEFGRIFPTGPGSWFESTFGAVLNEFSYSNPLHTPQTLAGIALDGFTASLTPTTAKVIARYHNGRPAITEAKTGRGTAVVIGAQASLDCHKPGHDKMERLLVRHALGKHKRPYACRGALAYRLAAPAADHYFLINDSNARAVKLDTGAYHYKSVTDAVTGEKLKLRASIKLEAHSGRWLRFQK
jgi:beta-galactosidase